MAVRVDITSRRGAPGHVVGLRRGMANGSCCWRLTARRGGRAELGQRSGGALGATIFHGMWLVLSNA
jgi:hypothetical protein